MVRNETTTRRPRLRLPLTKYEMVLEVLTVPLVLLNFALVFFSWSEIPSTISTHFDFQGLPTGQAGKEVLYFLCSVNLFIYAGITAMCFFPHNFNYLQTITPENARGQYLLARKFLSLLKLEISAVMLFYITTLLQAATDSTKPVNISDFYTLLAMLLITVTVYFVISLRGR